MTILTPETVTLSARPERKIYRASTRQYPIRAVLTYATLAVAVFVIFGPFIYALFNSFKTAEDVSLNPTLLLPTQGFSFEGYAKIIDLGFLQWAYNSFLVSVGIIASRLIFDTMAAYALSRIRFPMRNFIYALLLSTIFVPGIIMLIPRFLVLREFGLLDTHVGLVLPNMADIVGILLMKRYFDTLPPELEEAAFIDGANRFSAFINIILPGAQTVLLTLALLSFQSAWNDFTGPLVTFTKQQLYTLPLGVALMSGTFGSRDSNWNVYLAATVMAALPVIITYIVFQRFFLRGTQYVELRP
jgi:multiple sugar transport system permease protein